MPTTPLGYADSITVVGEEEGFELHISTDVGEYVVNVHGVTKDLIKVGVEMSDYWAEGFLAAQQHRADLEQRDAYDLRDPKHPDWHSVHADLWDSRSEK